jgi:nucleoside-diphosphate-sugar epimerase
MSGPVRLLIFGLGYSAGAFARRIKPEAEWIAATVRSPERATALAEEGFRAVVFDGNTRSEDAAAALAEATHLIVSIPPGEGTDPVLAHLRADIAGAKELHWIGYLSTIGVYGNYGGAWVSERTTPHPARGRTTARLAAERAWVGLADERGIPLAILRIAGIYGPGRNPFVNLKEGTARRVIKPGHVFNRIHVADIAQAIAAALDKRASGIFNLSDDEPAPQEDVVTYAAGLMDVPPPLPVPFEEADLSPMARSFYTDNKRVLNHRLKQGLGVTLRYPTYREGLTALWREGNWRD